MPHCAAPPQTALAVAAEPHPDSLGHTVGMWEEGEEIMVKVFVFIVTFHIHVALCFLGAVKYHEGVIKPNCIIWDAVSQATLNVTSTH